MTKEEFERVASRLGAEAREHPRRYRARVLAFGALGYAYVFVVMAALLAVVIALGWRIAREGGAGAHALAKLAISAAILWVAVLKSIWVRIDPPVGTELRPEEAPQLFADVEAIRRLLKVPPIHRTLVTDELNASVAQIPRLGFLGWHRNYLVLGAPLMRALRPAEFRGVLAHELGHLSRAHGRMSAWAYRVRERWSRVLTELERSGSWLKVVFERFFEWYAPRFAAYTFALSRAHEFEADRAAARIVGRAAYTSALKRLAIVERILAGHWSAVWSRTATEPTPPAEVYAAFHARLADPVAPAEAAEWLSEALAQRTEGFDTHPSLAERLAAAGDPDPAALPDWAMPPGGSAADHDLGEHAERITAQHEEEWRRAVADHWSSLHAEAVRRAARLAELDALATTGMLTPEERWEHAVEVARARGSEEALPMLRDLVQEGGIGAEPRFALGQMLLERGDPEGLRHIEDAMELDRDCTPAGSELAIEFLERAGREPEAERFRERLRAYNMETEKAIEERKLENLRARDRFLPHGLDPDALRPVVDALRKNPMVVRAWLARKEVEYRPEHPLYVLGVRPSSFLGYVSARKMRALVDWLATEVQFPGETIIVATVGEYRRIGKKLRKIAGAEIYERRR